MVLHICITVIVELDLLELIVNNVSLKHNINKLYNLTIPHPIVKFNKN